jgi:hypothetical protein
MHGATIKKNLIYLLLREGFYEDECKGKVWMLAKCL